MQLSQRDKRLLMILGPVAAVALLAFVFLLFTGKKHPAHVAASSAPRSVASAPTSATQPKTKPVSTLVFSGRDPFQALVSAPIVTGGSASTVTNPAPGVSPAPAPSGAPADGSSATISGHQVVLDDIFTASGQTKVQVEVDGAVYTVGVGQTFATSFKLESVSGTTANFVYGDQTFSLTQPSPSGS